MKFYIPIVLLTLMFGATARAQETEPELPLPEPLYQLGTTWSRPIIQILKSENTPNRRYQKWREAYLVTLGALTYADDARVFYSQPLHLETFDVQLQARGRRANLERDWRRLSIELAAVKSATPALKFWDSSRWLSRGTADFERATFTRHRASFTYTLVMRTFEIEALTTDGVTTFKASVTKDNGYGVSSGLCLGERFDPQTGFVLDQNGAVARDTLKNYRESGAR